MASIHRYIHLLFKKYPPNSITQRIKYIFEKNDFYYNCLVSETKFLNVNSTIQERVYYILNDLDVKKICKNCGSDVEFKSIFRGHKVFCSNKCRVEYGRGRVLHEWWINLSQEQRDHYVNHYKESYRNAFVIKYGCDVNNASLVPEIKDKIQKTNLERYGNTIPSKTTTIQDKMKQTNIERYGVEHIFCENSSIRQEIYRNNIIKFGDKFPANTPNIQQKILDSSYLNKTFDYNGTQLITQGYGIRVLTIFRELDVPIEYIKTEKMCDSFEYTYKNSKKRYYPDIQYKNLIIEVKSDYTFLNHRSYPINILKMKSVLVAKYSGIFIVYNKKNIGYILTFDQSDLSIFNNHYEIINLDINKLSYKKLQRLLK